MNVLLINGSPHKNGCTNAALAEVAKTLNEAGIDDLPHRRGPGGRLCKLRRLWQGGQMRLWRAGGRRAAAGGKG